MSMTDTATFDQSLAGSEGARGGWNAERIILAAIFAMVLVLSLSFAAGPVAQAWADYSGGAKASPATKSFGASEVAAMSVDDKAQIVVEGDAAKAGNAAIPLLGLPLEQVKAFGLNAAKNETYLTALKCLTQAVYYEAAYEPLPGRRAVAQVVLNRVKHPAYPNSVCGVVYQGAERRTGCQFSFTCDGALLRGPAAAPWREAEAVALAALGGYTERSVGTATHYHADYVLPKWAFTLGKITQIGRHIFYRFGGSSGTAAAFSDRYAGLERIPALDFAALRDRALDDGTLLDGTLDPALQLVPGLTVAPDVTDRHAEADVGGRIDMTKAWRPSIPDPVATGGRLKEVLAQTSASDAPVSADPPKQIADAAIGGLDKPK